MIELYFMLEEPSMKALLAELLPRVIPEGINYYLIKHEGKQDLEKSLPRKMKAIPQTARFIVLRDQDSEDCYELKQRLSSLCATGGRDDAVVRIVCHELESWFIGDLQAVEQAVGRIGLARRQEEKKYRDPDRLNNAAQELKKLVPAYQKISGARNIGQYLNVHNNRSVSFKVFIQGIFKAIA